MVATERIEIGYKLVSKKDYPGFYHTYFIYTDKNGKKYFLRGGPDESNMAIFTCV